MIHRKPPPAPALTISLCLLGALCEGFDVQAAGVAAAGISHDLHPAPQALGLFFSASGARALSGRADWRTCRGPLRTQSRARGIDRGIRQLFAPDIARARNHLPDRCSVSDRSGPRRCHAQPGRTRRGLEQCAAAQRQHRCGLYRHAPRRRGGQPDRLDLPAGSVARGLSDRRCGTAADRSAHDALPAREDRRSAQRLATARRSA